MRKKKFVVLIIVLGLLLSACVAASPENSDTIQESQNGATEGTTITEGAGETEPTPGTETTQGTEPTEGETTPTTGNTEPTEGSTEPPVTEPPVTEPPVTEPPVTEPPVTEPPATEPPATEPPVTEPPATEPPTTKPPATTQPTAPTKPSRPTSSATCRDTGSKTIWIDPAVSENEETDPQRTEYVNGYGKATDLYELTGSRSILFGYGGLDMYIGHTYGMPYRHDGEPTDLRWVTSDPSIATVNQVGFVTPLKEGEVEIGFYNNDNEYFRRTVRVHVEDKYTEAELERMAKEEAKKIADYVMNELSLNSDLERIGAAAKIVYGYVKEGKDASKTVIENGELVTVRVPGYNRPFGALVTKRSTCAGSTRAMGLVLQYMGFEWYHVNENQWNHQWCVVYDVDGKTAFADGTWNGIVGYGDWTKDQGYEYDTENGLVPFTGLTPFY